MSDIFSPYAIDFMVKNTSKTFGFSKKKITFKFGIANPPALANGESGAACRGSEHEIIFIWSLNSGKRQIMCDGKDIHYSETGQNGWTADQVFQHHFELRVAGLNGPLRAHLITQPANRDVPYIKPFDLRLNGVSYFSMPQIFQLGTPQMVVRPVKGKPKGSRGGGERGGGYSNRGGQDNDSHLSPQEKQAIAAAKLASMQDLNHGRGGGGYGAPPALAPTQAVVDDLISFDAPAPAPTPYGQQQPPPQAQAQYSNYSLGGLPPQPPRNPAYAPQAPQQQQYQQYQQPGGTMDRSFSGSQASQPNQFQQPSYGQPQLPPQQQQMQQPQSGAFYGQQPPLAVAPVPYDPHQQAMPSPAAKSVASYQSYGSAPAFAQPPQQQQQQQQQPPQMQQQPQQGYYGQPQGY